LKKQDEKTGQKQNKTKTKKKTGRKSIPVNADNRSKIKAVRWKRTILFLH